MNATVKSADRVLDILELFASTDRADVRTDLGRLFLSPETLMLVRSGHLGLRGLATEPFEPSVSLPAGVTLYWQAVIGSPARLSNLEPTTFVAF